MATITMRGQLEIDMDRGVIYFHQAIQKRPPTPLRICFGVMRSPIVGLDARKGQIDITIKESQIDYYKFEAKE